jgi:Domain of unknown function (DUF4365)
MERTEATGKLGEAIFVRDIMNFCGNQVPFFNPIFLGEKAEAVDYLVVLVGVRGRTPFFFVQVKTTKLGYTANKSAPRLRVKISGKTIDRIKGHPAPTYLIGIDETNSRSFIVAILEGATGGVTSVSTRHPLNEDNLKKLWLEIQDYWQARNMVMSHSVFLDQR